jgi:hypothetical protein
VAGGWRPGRGRLGVAGGRRVSALRSVQKWGREPVACERVGVKSPCFVGV